jgi:uncharacterized Zn-finger protein
MSQQHITASTSSTPAATANKSNMAASPADPKLGEKRKASSSPTPSAFSIATLPSSSASASDGSSTDGGSSRNHCEQCNVSFSSKFGLTRHCRTHNGEKPFACEECGQGFTRNSDLTIHRRMHTGERPFRCDECGECFASSTALVVHERTHVEVPPFSCERCDQVFDSHSTLTSHKCPPPSRSSGAPVLFSCDRCPRQFTTMSQLTRHRHTHTEIPDRTIAIPCDCCDLVFPSVDAFSSHRSTHFPGSSLRCEKCRQEFTDTSVLADHLQSMHAPAPESAIGTVKDKHNVCEDCGKTFGRRSDLSMHARSHLANKPFPCHCGRSFTRRDRLLTHQLTHGPPTSDTASAPTPTPTPAPALAPAPAPAPSPASAALTLPQNAVGVSALPSPVTITNGVAMANAVFTVRTDSADPASRKQITQATLVPPGQSNTFRLPQTAHELTLMAQRMRTDTTQSARSTVRSHFSWSFLKQKIRIIRDAVVCNCSDAQRTTVLQTASRASTYVLISACRALECPTFLNRQLWMHRFLNHLH